MNRWGVIAGWSGFAIVLIAVLVMARRTQEQAVAKKPNVSISVVDENAFLTEQELIERLRRNSLTFDGQLMENLKTDDIEAFIRKMHEVESVEVFKRLGGNWDIRLKVRQPLARIFNTKGESFYIDAKGATMDPSPNFTARVFVFSGNIPDQSDSLTVDDIMHDDSLRDVRLLDDIYRIAKYVCNDRFLRAQISQVVRMKSGDFVLIPQVGSHKIIFGSAFTESDVKEKMDKLTTFYKEGLPYEGWDKYETINLKFRNQIVCKKKHVEEPEELPVPAVH
jgi:cell division protein FtsQ